MATVNFTAFRSGLARYMDRVCDNRDVLHVTRGRGRAVVVVAEDEFESMMETLHLLRSPANAAHLLASIAEADRGETEEFDPT
jgi:antitoxin YefM